MNSTEANRLAEAFLVALIGDPLFRPESASKAAKIAFCWADAFLAECDERRLASVTQAPIDVGEGYRQLGLDEVIQVGDQIYCHIPGMLVDPVWRDTSANGCTVRRIGMIHRRKV